MSNRVAFLLTGLFVFFVLPMLAFAATTPIDVTDPNVFGQVYEAVKNDNWRFVASFVVIGLSQLIIWIDEKTGTDTWLDKGKWKWSVTILISVLGALGTKLLSSEPLGGIGALIATALYGAFLGAASTGIFKGVKEFKDDK